MLSGLLRKTIVELAAIKNMGTKSVNEILSIASSYLQGKLIVDTPLPTKEGDIQTKSEMVESMRFEELPLSLLSLSTRSNNALMRCGYLYIRELADCSFEDFKQIKNFGAKSAEEIYEAVQRFCKEYKEKNSIEETSVSEPVNESESNWEDIIQMIETIHRECEQCGTEMLLTECDTYATRCIEGGMPPQVLKRILGHTDITVTMNTYCDTFDPYADEHIVRADCYMKDKNLSIMGVE